MLRLMVCLTLAACCACAAIRAEQAMVTPRCANICASDVDCIDACEADDDDL